jgi:DNA topoisomerase-1
MHTITLEDAIDLFRLPRTLGEDKDEEVSVGVGRFGPFAKRGSVYASLKKEDDPYTIDLARAVFLIEEKEEIARNRIIKEFPDSDIQVLNGRYGPYLSDGKLNGKIPKDREPASLTFEEVVTLMEETGKPMRKGFGKKAAAKKVAKKATKKTAAASESGAGVKKVAKKATKKAAKKATKKVVKKAAGASASAAPAAAASKTTAKKAAAKKVAVRKTAASASAKPLDDDAPF